MKDRIVKIKVKDENVGTGFLISLDNEKELDVILTVCHIFGSVNNDKWEMWEVEIDDIEITSDYFCTNLKVVNILYKEGDADEKDIALIYIEKVSCIDGRTNPSIPYDDKKVLNSNVFIEGYGQEETNQISRVINGEIYNFVNYEKKLYRINYYESDRVDNKISIEINKGMSGAPVFMNLNNIIFFVGMQKMVSSELSTDGILGAFTYKYCIKLIKELYNIELPLKNSIGRLINNDALFNNMHVIQQKFDIIPNNKEHIGASISFEDIRELKNEFISELIDTIVDWVYSAEKYEILKEKSISKGKTERAANFEILNMVREKFRRCKEDNIIAQGQIAELLLFHFIQRYLKAVPLLRKENIENVEIKEGTLSNVIHYKVENNENIIILGEARSFFSNYDFKDAFLISINSILNTYKNHKREINLYVHEDFLNDDMNLVAESYINKSMKSPKIHLIDFIMYNETEDLRITSEDEIKNQIEDIIRNRYSEFENDNIDIKNNPILSRITYVLFPVWEIEKLAELFKEYL